MFWIVIWGLSSAVTVKLLALLLPLSRNGDQLLRRRCVAVHVAGSLKITVTQAVLSPSGMHLLMYNFIHRVTATVLSWGTQQQQQQEKFRVSQLLDHSLLVKWPLTQELRSRVKIEVDVLASLSLIVRTVSVDVKQY